MEFDQICYSVLNLNLHYQNVQRELELLSKFLQAYNTKINSAIDIGCGDGGITEKLRKLLGLNVIYGLDLNKRFLNKAKRKGIKTIHGDMNSINLKEKLVVSLTGVDTPINPHHTRTFRRIGSSQVTTQYDTGSDVISHRLPTLNIENTEKFDLVISYGSLHHSENTRNFIANLKKISNKHLLIVDNTVRKTLFHGVTGSKYFPLEPSPFPTRTKEEIIEALERVGCSIVAVRTNLNANFWHDRSFFLATI